MLLAIKCFSEGIMQLLQTEDYDPYNVFNRKGKEWVSRLFRKHKLQELELLLAPVKANVIKTIQIFFHAFDTFTPKLFSERNNE